MQWARPTWHWSVYIKPIRRCAAQSRLDAVTRGVRLQERKIRDLTEKQQAAQTALREQQSQAAQLELDLKTRDAHIEKLRQQQQQAMTNKEYQTFLVEINTEKVDRNKVEDQTIKAMEQVEGLQKELAELTGQLDGERTKLTTLQAADRRQTAEVQADIDRLSAQLRDQAAEAVPARARDAFERLSRALRRRGHGAHLQTRPPPRGIHLHRLQHGLVADIYNRLHVRDEPVFCPSCRRLLYIPDDLPVETGRSHEEEDRAKQEARRKRVKRQIWSAASPQRPGSSSILGTGMDRSRSNSTAAPAAIPGRRASASLSCAPRRHAAGDAGPVHRPGDQQRRRIPGADPGPGAGQSSWGAHKLVIRGDSELIIKQMRGEYRVKNPDLRDLYDEAQFLLHQFDEARIEHNYREKNALADKLANLAMDRRADVTEAGEDALDAPAPVPPKAGDSFVCPRCGCLIELRNPSSIRPHQLRPFLCQCGQRMHPRNTKDE